MDIWSFAALRPCDEYVEKFVCPPYDVLSQAQVEELTHDHSLLQITRPDGSLKYRDLEGRALHQKGFEKLKELIQEGILILEKDPAIYLYEEEVGGHLQRGIVGIFQVEDYLNGKIARHELTLADKEMDRTLHFETVKAQTEPVFLFAKELNLRDLEGERLYELTTEDGVTHRLYRLTDEEIGEVKGRFNELQKIYIADGHHRTASAAKVARRFSSGIMAVVFDESELKLLPYHRKLSKVEKLEKLEVIEALQDSFKVVDEPWTGAMPNPGELYWVQEEFSLKLLWKGSDSEDPASNIDAARVQRTILEPIFGIENPREDDRLDFEGGDQPSLEGYDVLLVMPAVTTEEIINVADKNGIMPPKSTWFEPKLLSGLFLYPYQL